MLVLTRREGESVMIGEEVEVRVVSIKGDRIRLAIKAPIRIAVHRREVYDQVVAERKAEEERLAVERDGGEPVPG